MTMKRTVAGVILILLVLSSAVSAYESLQAVYDIAESNGLYDKYLCLDPNVQYLGDLSLSDHIKVRIDGNGAIIFAPEEEIAIEVHQAGLDIFNCVIIGGSCPLFYDSGSEGVIRNNTIIGGSSYGIAVVYPGPKNVFVWDNIIVGSFIGFYCIENHHPKYLGFNTVYDTGRFRYAELCPG